MAVNIATRQSALALWQAHHVQELLKNLGLETELLKVVTTGDKLQKSALAHIQLPSSGEAHLTTGKGLFIKEIQESLFANKAHLAVHSMKDMPGTQTPGLCIAALLPRENPRDVLVLSDGVLQECGITSQNLNRDYSFTELRSLLLTSKEFQGGVLGTTSARRQFLVRKEISEQANLKILRGNVDSRLGRLERGEFAAIFLAEAGLNRLELFQPHRMFSLPIAQFIPAAAQGAIAIEIRENDTELKKQVVKLNHLPTLFAVSLERLALFLLGGDCHHAIGVHFDDKNLWVISEQKNSYKEISVPLDEEEIQILKKDFLVAETYSSFFTGLLQSPFCKRLKQLLREKGFEVP